MTDIVATSDRIYRLVLNVYPRAFRDEYGEEMAQTLRDQVRDTWTERRIVGVAALWLRVLLDTARSAFVEHLRQGRTVSFSRNRLGYGLATGFGFPLALVTFAYRLHPAIAGTGFLLAGMGLRGLCKRLEIDSTALIATAWVGATLGLYGTADIYYRGEFFGSYAVPAAFVLLTLALAIMGHVALRNRTFGPFSFVPLGVAATGGLWFLMLLVAAGEYRDAMRTSGLLAHVALWFILGVLLWADSPRQHPPVWTAKEERQINRSAKDRR